MKRKTRSTGRFLAMLLALTMLLSIVPVSAFAAEDILVDTAENRETGKLAVDAKIWSDRTYYFDKMPNYLSGLPYVLTGINTGSTTYTATGSGYAYVMIPVGVANSQLDTLKEAGWTQIESYPLVEGTNGNVLDSDISEEIALLEKAITKDDSFTLGAWHILCTSKTQLEIPDILVDTAEGRDVGELAVGAKIWSDRTYTFSMMPEYMDGLPYVLTGINTGSTTYTAKDGGYAYVMIPIGIANSQLETLEAAGRKQ